MSNPCADLIVVESIFNNIRLFRRFHSTSRPKLFVQITTAIILATGLIHKSMIYVRFITWSWNFIIVLLSRAEDGFEMSLLSKLLFKCGHKFGIKNNSSGTFVSLWYHLLQNAHRRSSNTHRKISNTNVKQTLLLNSQVQANLRNTTQNDGIKINTWYKKYICSWFYIFKFFSWPTFVTGICILYTKVTL